MSVLEWSHTKVFQLLQPSIDITSVILMVSWIEANHGRSVNGIVLKLLTCEGGSPRQCAALIKMTCTKSNQKPENEKPILINIAIAHFFIQPFV